MIADTYTVGDHVTIGDGTTGTPGTITDTDPTTDTYQVDFTDPTITDGLWYSRLGAIPGTGIHQGAAS